MATIGFPGSFYLKFELFFCGFAYLTALKAIGLIFSQKKSEYFQKPLSSNKLELSKTEEFMKRFSPRTFLASLAMASILFAAVGCEAGTKTDKTGEGDSDTTAQVVKVEPQDFPVNELPESYFGKTVTVAQEKGLKVTSANIMQGTGAFPEWLDQIISRESIVQFAQGILKDMPDELEFVQNSSATFDGPDNWKVFVVNFTTRPSSASIVIYGAYSSEEKSYWAAQNSKGKLTMDVKNVLPTEKGVEIMGEWTHGEKPVAFRANLTKETATITESI